MSDHTRTKVPFCLDDLIEQVCPNNAAISQPTAVRADAPVIIGQAEHWLIKFTEASYKGWRRDGSHSYGL